MTKYFQTVEELKHYCKTQLEETDWAVLPDVNLVNKEEFIRYRTTIRNLYIEGLLGCFVPDMPKAIWNS